MNAVCAARVSSAPSGGVSSPAATTAPPSVARAASAAWTGTPVGSASPSIIRYIATPMLPKIAMPSAPPNSALVSEIADAAPARSGGADPTTRSVVSVNTGARPSANIVEPTANIANPVDASMRVNIANPIAAEREAAGHHERRADPPHEHAVSASNRPRSARAHGTVHRPARNGDRPRTSCRYCGRKRKPPNKTGSKGRTSPATR